MTATVMADHDTTVRTEITIPAIRLRRGGRTLYQICLKADTFGQIVPTVPSRVVQTAQRAYYEHHAKRIARFMIDNPDSWAFGPISLALTSKYMSFTAFGGLSANSVEYGTLSLLPGSTETMLILDGQHRRGALHLIRMRALPRITEPEYDMIEASIDAADLSVDLYEIDELSDVRRVFNWMNTTKSINSSERILLDNTNPFNEAVQRLTGSLPNQFLSDKVAWLANLCIPLTDNEFRRTPARVTPAAPYWLSALNLKTILMARAVGAQRLAPTARKELTPARIVQMAKTFFNAELPALRPEWGKLRDREIQPTHLPGLRDTTLVYDPSMVAIAAWTLNMADAGGKRQEELSDLLAAQWQNLDLGVENPTKLLVLDNRDEPGRPTVVTKKVRTSAKNLVDAAKDSA